MAAGGFKFGQDSVLYDSSTYSTKRDWALAVHKARCNAFFIAQKRAGDDWSTTGSSSDIIETITTSEGSYTLYIKDLHPTSSDTTGSYPAFVSIWENVDTNYAIITSNGMTRNPSHSSDITKGMYIHEAHLPVSVTSRYSFKSLAHSYASFGFDSSDFTNSNVEDGELPVFPIYGFDGSTINTTANTVNNAGSMIYAPTQGVTYSFGYAIRDTVIECFYRTSNFDSNTGWLWSIIGPILSDSTISYFSPIGGSNCTENTVINSSYYARYSSNSIPWACIGFDNKFFPSSSSNLVSTRSVRLTPSFMPNRCNTTSPSELLFSAGCLSLCQSSGSIVTESSLGIDGNGNCVAGLINTDILRIVSAQSCSVGGSTYQSGKFVVPQIQANIANSDDFGILLGWDSSNESIV